MKISCPNCGICLPDITITDNKSPPTDKVSYMIAGFCEYNTKDDRYEAKRFSWMFVHGILKDHNNWQDVLIYCKTCGTTINTRIKLHFIEYNYHYIEFPDELLMEGFL